MIELTFPDGAKKSFSKGVTPIDIAKTISQGLARNIISVDFNGKTIETTSQIFDCGKIKFYTWNDKEGKKAFWHSSAHVLAQALEDLYSNIKLTIGPAKVCVSITIGKFKTPINIHKDCTINGRAAI